MCSTYRIICVYVNNRTVVLKTVYWFRSSSGGSGGSGSGGSCGGGRNTLTFLTAKLITFDTIYNRTVATRTSFKAIAETTVAVALAMIWR